MITVLLTNAWLDFKAFRYDTNFFDEAVEMFVDDWIAGKIVWEFEELNDAFTPEWLEANGYPNEDCETAIYKQTEIVTYVWHWCGETDGDDQIIYGYFVKTAPVSEDEWPTLGICSGISALDDEP